MFEKSSRVLLVVTRVVDDNSRLVVVELPSSIRGYMRLFSLCAMLPVAAIIHSGLFAVKALGHGGDAGSVHAVVGSSGWVMHGQNNLGSAVLHGSTTAGGAVAT
ncbi:hypothetical protein CDL15_Pgr019495 [Punica granatum]|nr:hypothetical protein CDL15_Pgr019495 [Punica granatum]